MARRLLIIDDDPSICEVFKDRLEAKGYSVIVAHDGMTALALMTLEADQSPIGGVLLDVHMPVMDGLQVLRELRLHHQGIAVVVMTADPDPRSREAALRLGASRYLQKPIDGGLFDQICREIFPLFDQP
jgi:CheY-like chemotaxis protein